MATRTAKRRQPEVSRGEILDAALACFAEHGYHGASIDAIAERAGLSKGAIYWHFAGKRELFLALAARAEESARELEKAVAGAPDWRAALRELFARAPQLLEHELPLVRLSLEYVAQGASDPELRARSERKQGRWEAIFAAQIARGVAAGALRPVAARDVGLLVGATIAGMTLLKVARPELDLEPVWRAAEEILWRGLRT